MPKKDLDRLLYTADKTKTHKKVLKESIKYTCRASGFSIRMTQDIVNGWENDINIPCQDLLNASKEDIENNKIDLLQGYFGNETLLNKDQNKNNYHNNAPRMYNEKIFKPITIEFEKYLKQQKKQRRLSNGFVKFCTIKALDLALECKEHFGTETQARNLLPAAYMKSNSWLYKYISQKVKMAKKQTRKEIVQKIKAKVEQLEEQQKNTLPNTNQNLVNSHSHSPLPPPAPAQSQYEAENGSGFPLGGTIGATAAHMPAMQTSTTVPMRMEQMGMVNLDMVHGMNMNMNMHPIGSSSEIAPYEIGQTHSMGGFGAASMVNKFNTNNQPNKQLFPEMVHQQLNNSTMNGVMNFQNSAMNVGYNQANATQIPIPNTNLHQNYNGIEQHGQTPPERSYSHSNNSICGSHNGTVYTDYTDYTEHSCRQFEYPNNNIGVSGVNKDEIYKNDNDEEYSASHEQLVRARERRRQVQQERVIHLQQVSSMQNMNHRVIPPPPPPPPQPQPQQPQVIDSSDDLNDTTNENEDENDNDSDNENEDDNEIITGYQFQLLTREEVEQLAQQKENKEEEEEEDHKVASVGYSFNSNNSSDVSVGAPNISGQVDSRLNSHVHYAYDDEHHQDHIGNLNHGNVNNCNFEKIQSDAFLLNGGLHDWNGNVPPNMTFDNRYGGNSNGLDENKSVIFGTNSTNNSNLDNIHQEMAMTSGTDYDKIFGDNYMKMYGFDNNETKLHAQLNHDSYMNSTSQSIVSTNNNDNNNNNYVNNSSVTLDMDDTSMAPSFEHSHIQHLANLPRTNEATPSEMMNDIDDIDDIGGEAGNIIRESVYSHQNNEEEHSNLNFSKTLINSVFS